jgi:hypothetical protein
MHGSYCNELRIHCISSRVKISIISYGKRITHTAGIEVSKKIIYISLDVNKTIRDNCCNIITLVPFISLYFCDSFHVHNSLYFRYINL